MFRSLPPSESKEGLEITDHVTRIFTHVDSLSDFTPIFILRENINMHATCLVILSNGELDTIPKGFP